MTEFVRNRDMDWATFRELLVLSYGNLQSIWPLIHYSFMGATKARTFEFYGTRRQLDPPRVEPQGAECDDSGSSLHVSGQTLCNLCIMPTASLLLTALSDFS